MELPYPERKRVGITHYRSYHFIFCSQKPGASQWWGLSTRAQTGGVLLASLKFREPAASVILSDSRLSCIHPSAQLSKHRGAHVHQVLLGSWKSTFLITAPHFSLQQACQNDIYLLLFIALHFFKPLLTQALLHPVSSFFPVLTKAEQFSRALRCSEHMEEELLCSQQKVAVSLNS